MNLVVLLTDFGDRDGFVGAVKGVMLSINPSLKFVDLTHHIDPFNITEGALVLRAHYRFFPRGSIFLGVVDPGVGSKRKAVALRCGDYFFVGPMNGLFDLVLEELKEPIECHLIEKFTLQRINETFHGRDVFAPVCGYLSRGVPLEWVGRKIEYEFLLKLERAVEFEGGVEGRLVYFDRYGNAITNVRCMNYSKAIFRGEELRVVSHFLAGEKDRLNSLCGSFGYMELFVPLKSAKELFSLELGERILFYF